MVYMCMCMRKYSTCMYVHACIGNTGTADGSGVERARRWVQSPKREAVTSTRYCLHASLAGTCSGERGEAGDFDPDADRDWRSRGERGEPGEVGWRNEQAVRPAVPAAGFATVGASVGLSASRRERSASRSARLAPSLTSDP